MSDRGRRDTDSAPPDKHASGAPSLSPSWRWVILLTALCAAVALALGPILWAKFNADRALRTNNQASINAFTCGENNRQDEQLARLVKVSVAPTKFGAGVDPNALQAFDVRVLSAINRVSTLQREAATKDKSGNIEQVFGDALKDLQDTTPCRKLALRVAAITGADPDSITITNLRRGLGE